MCGRVAIGSGLLTATTLDVCALILGEIGLDPRIDTGLAVTALGVPGRGLLTATGHIVSVRVPLPAGEIGVTARGHTLSRVALVTARGHAGDYLPLLPARRQVRQDSWPDEISRRVLRRLSLSLLLFLKVSVAVTPAAGGAFFSALSVCCAGSCQVLFDPVRILFPGSSWRCCGRDCTVCWVWVQLCPSTSAAGAVALGAATAIPAGAGDPPAARCCAWRAWASAASGGFPLSRASSSLVQRWVRQTVVEVSQVAVSFACAFFSSSGEVLPVFLGFFEVMDPVFFRPLLVAPSLEAPQRGPARFCGWLLSL